MRNEATAAEERMDHAWVDAFGDPEDLPNWDSPEYRLAQIKRRVASHFAMLFRTRALRTRHPWWDPKFEAAESNVDGPFEEATRLVWDDKPYRTLHVAVAVASHTWNVFERGEFIDGGEFVDPDDFTRFWEWLHACPKGDKCSALCRCQNTAS